MRRLILSAALVAGCVAAPLAVSAETAAPTATPPLVARYGVKPFPGTSEQAAAVVNALPKMPMASFTFTASKDGAKYTDLIVGQSPHAATKTTTTVKVKIVPLVIGIGSAKFDSTKANTCDGTNLSDVSKLVNSPIFKAVTFDGGTGTGHAAKVNGVSMGTGTFMDQFRRAEFLKYIGGAGSAYHLKFSVSQTAAISVPAAKTNGHSSILTGTGCTRLGGLEINWFDNYIVNTLLPAVSATPDTFVVFVMSNVVMYDNKPANCCTLGYHGALADMQTYSPLDYETTGLFTKTSDISVAVHEVGEWMDDPAGNNPTPDWGGIGQVSGCQGNWEVGDPLSGTLFPPIKMANGVTYNPQEMAFWNWFYSADHDAAMKVGAGGKYSMNGTFGGPSKVCPNGGTFNN